MPDDLITRLREAKELTFNLFWEVAEHLNVEADGRLKQLDIFSHTHGSAA